jgi:hypothetical protein
MLHGAASETRPDLDFLNPRKKPEPPNRRRTYYIAGGVAAAVVLLGLGWMQFSLWSMDSEISRLTKQLSETKENAKKATTPIEQADRLDQFAAGDVTWLDELALFSQKFPKAESAQVKDISWLMDPKAGGGKTTIKGLADQPGTITDIESALRDPGGMRLVVGTGAKVDPQAAPPRRWDFTEYVTVKPSEPGDTNGPPAPTAPKAEAKSPAKAPASANTKSAAPKSSSSSSKKSGGQR